MLLQSNTFLLFDQHNEILFSQMTKQCSFAQNAHNVLPGKI